MGGAVLLAAMIAGRSVPGQVSPSNGDQIPSLAYFVGDWDVRLTFELPDGSEGQGYAACEAALVVGDAFLQQEYTSTFRGVRLIVRQLLGHDDQRGVFVQFQLHQGGGAPTKTRHLEGGFSEDGTVLTLEGDTFDSFTGGPVRLRAVTKIVDQDHFTVEEWFMEPGGQETLVVVLDHERKLGARRSGGAES